MHASTISSLPHLPPQSLASPWSITHPFTGTIVQSCLTCELLLMNADRDETLTHMLGAISNNMLACCTSPLLCLSSSPGIKQHYYLLFLCIVVHQAALRTGDGKSISSYLDGREMAHCLVPRSVFNRISAAHSLDLYHDDKHSWCGLMQGPGRQACRRSPAPIKCGCV